MKTKVLILRALAVIFVKKALRYVIIALTVCMIIFLTLTWLLAISFSNWWWFLLVPFFIALLVIFFVFALIYFILQIIYPYKLSINQKQQLELFTTKVQKLLEARTLGWPLFLIICVKDLLIYNELRSLKQLLSDSLLLKNDFARLEDTFKAQVG